MYAARLRSRMLQESFKGLSTPRLPHVVSIYQSIAKSHVRPDPQNGAVITEARVDERRRCAREPGRVVGGGQQTPEFALRAAAAARPTTRRFQSIPRDPHAMEAGTARLRGRPHRMLRTRVVLDCAAACDAGPATTETAARLANIHCGGRGKLRLIQCVPRTVRNGAHLQTFLTGQSLQGQSPPGMFCLLSRAANVRALAYASGHVCVRARA